MQVTSSKWGRIPRGPCGDPAPLTCHAVPATKGGEHRHVAPPLHPSGGPTVSGRTSSERNDTGPARQAHASQTGDAPLPADAAGDGKVTT
jgi:hypothetical protein